MKIYGYIKFLETNAKKEQEIQNKLEMYKILYQAYADEIKNLWQRSIFLGAFMTLAWGGYGALQLKFIDKVLDKSFALGAYHYYSILLCFVIIILSLLWIAMAKGSKFVQEAHEKHIENLNFDKLNEVDTKINQYKRLFCDLDTYETKLNEKDRLSKKLLINGALQAYRYSPSKINIILGWFSVLIAVSLGAVHLFVAFSEWCIVLQILFSVLSVIFIAILVCCITKSLKHYLKGGKHNQKNICICKIILKIQKIQWLQTIYSIGKDKCKKVINFVCE